MGFIKNTGVEQPIRDAKIVAANVAESAKRMAKEGKKSLLNAVSEAEDEDEGKTS